MVRDFAATRATMDVESTAPQCIPTTSGRLELVWTDVSVRQIVSFYRLWSKSRSAQQRQAVRGMQGQDGKTWAEQGKWVLVQRDFSAAHLEGQTSMHTRKELPTAAEKEADGGRKCRRRLKV